uniref:Uncharacterized protein n=1 Tax=Rhizophora mucronata TaxID=61149 RepID=A0A2P2M5E3_RHIMU
MNKPLSRLYHSVNKPYKTHKQTEYVSQ